MEACVTGGFWDPGGFMTGLFIVKRFSACLKEGLLGFQTWSGLRESALRFSALEWFYEKISEFNRLLFKP